MRILYFIKLKLFRLDASDEFRQGMEKVQRLLNVPSKLNDLTSVLQAIAKLISEKLNPTAVQACINEKISLLDKKEVIFNLGPCNISNYLNLHKYTGILRILSKDHFI